MQRNLVLALLLINLMAVPFVPARAAVDLILIEKSQRRMTLYDNGKIVDVFSVALGWNPRGHKQFEGDGRTPEGVYKINQRNANSQFFKSLRISYPNSLDKVVANSQDTSPGGMIMIHGLPNDKTALDVLHPDRDWTEGCIAVTNDEIEEIWNQTSLGTSVVIVP